MPPHPSPTYEGYRLIVGEGLGRSCHSIPRRWRVHKGLRRASSEHSNYEHRIAAQYIIDTERKTLRKKSMKTKYDFVDAHIKRQGLDVRNQATPEIVTKTGMLTLVKPIAIDQIIFRIG
jgi:hypothetical protein